jgi:chromate transporter
VLITFTRLGLTSFGGPVAHLGYGRHACVERGRRLRDDSYADLAALCQYFPGPASSQVGIALGYLRAGVPGALAAWLGFTLPWLIALVAFAFGVQAFGGAQGPGWFAGL